MLNIKKKVLPITLTILLGLGSFGIANAAGGMDYQKRMNNSIQADSKPIPINTNLLVTKAANGTNMINNNAANNTSNADLQNQMYQACLKLMQDMTPEQMLEMYKAWLNTSAQDSQQKQSTAVQQKNSISTLVAQNTTNNNFNADLQNQMYQACQQMMQNMTPQQMMEMCLTWMDNSSQSPQQKQSGVVQQKNNTYTSVPQNVANNNSNKAWTNATAKSSQESAPKSTYRSGNSWNSYSTNQNWNNHCGW